MDHKQQRDLARLLAALRRDGRQQSGLNAALVPPDKDTAYCVARLVEEELGWQVAGWKIAAAKAEMQRDLRTDSPIYGRVFAPGVKLSPGRSSMRGSAARSQRSSTKHGSAPTCRHAQDRTRSKR